MAMEKTFDAQEAEPRIYAAWEKRNAFAAGANATPGAETFSIMIPPPNVTGSLHMGHAFNNTLQDILIRWHRMRGHDTLWQPGTDHAGIATQMVVERELADNGEPGRREMGREKFIERVWQQKVKSRGNIRGQLERLGASCDWSREAFTMGGAPGDPDKGNGPNFHDAVIKVFVDMYHKGLIYRGKRLVNWDPQFETAISDLEVENVETPGHMWHFKYPLAGGATYEYVEKDADGNVTLRETRDWISIATTRPETMLGDGAVAVHPSDERYAPIVGKLCEIPVGPKEHRRLIPIITDEYPDPNFGSGAVKITGAHDFNDYAVARRNGIPLYVLMDGKGRMRTDGLSYDDSAETATRYARNWAEMLTATEGRFQSPSDHDVPDVSEVNLVPEDLRGLDRFEARKRVVEQITAEGLAVMTDPDDPRLGQVRGTSSDDEGSRPAPVPLVEAKPIMQPFGDRSKVVIEPMLTDQWFVDAEKIVGPALDAVKGGTVSIVPESGEKTYYHWLENIEPWCISRQLWWGHRVPVWYGSDLSTLAGHDTPDLETLDADAFFNGHTAICQPDEVEARAAAFRFAAERLGQTDFDVIIVEDEAAARAAFAREARAGRPVYPIWRDPAVLDTWFSSGLWPIGTLGWPDDTPELERYFPTSVLVTGHDILFFWVARMMMMQLAVVHQVPFTQVYLHGLVRDAKGKKMSKSLGNVVDPLEIIDEYGADALRFASAAMAALGGVLKLDLDRIKGYRNFTTKLWNAVRFAEMNGVYETAPPAAPPAAAQTANRWIVGETARARETVDAALDGFRFNDAANALYAFVWGRVCDWYVEFSKPLLDSDDAAVVAETRATMGWVLDQCMILLHPIMPFITEELWQTTARRDKMLVHADWPAYRADDLVDAASDREMTWVISLIEGVRSARAQVHVPAGLKIPMVRVGLDAAGRAALDSNEALIKRLARVEAIAEVTEMPKGAITVAVEGGTFGLPLADIIDVAEEKARLEKTLAKLDKEMAGLKGRLGNADFVQSAPEDVVEEARQNLEIKEVEAAKLKAAVDRLAEIG